MPPGLLIVKPAAAGVYPLPVAGDDSHRTASAAARQFCLQLIDFLLESVDLCLYRRERRLVALQVSGSYRVKLHAAAEHFLFSFEI